MVSLTVLREVLIATLVIYAYKGIELVTFDVPGDYLYADMPKKKSFIKTKRKISGYNVSDQSGAQEEREVKK